MLPHLLVIALITPAVVSCGGDRDDSEARGGVLRLAVTTSTRDSGLLDVVVPVFEKEQGVRVDVIAVGTGKALKLGEAGDVDVVLVHSRQFEDAFVAAGHGTRREDVMYNSFEILGPPGDPAAVAGADPLAALQKIGAGQHRFVSRGDDSGTHNRELSLWQKGGGRPDWDDYIESGRGMGASLIMADQMEAYILADRGTYLSFKDKIRLAPLAAASQDLKNPYGIIVVDPNKHPAIRGDLANAFVDFIVSPPAQRLIRDYTINGERLFHPLRPSASD
jgi:tungstate transport system substrate-binding protein